MSAEDWNGGPYMTTVWRQWSPVNLVSKCGSCAMLTYVVEETIFFLEREKFAAPAHPLFAPAPLHFPLPLSWHALYIYISWWIMLLAAFHTTRICMISMLQQWIFFEKWKYCKQTVKKVTIISNFGDVFWTFICFSTEYRICVDSGMCPLTALSQMSALRRIWIRLP